MFTFHAFDRLNLNEPMHSRLNITEHVFRRSGIEQLPKNTSNTNSTNHLFILNKVLNL